MMAEILMGDKVRRGERERKNRDEERSEGAMDKQGAAAKLW